MIFKIQNPKAGPFQLTFTNTLGKYDKLMSITNLFNGTFIYCIVNLNTHKWPLTFFPNDFNFDVCLGSEFAFEFA